MGTPQRPDTRGGPLVPLAGNWVTVAEAARQLRREGQATVHLQLPGSVTLEQWRAWKKLRDSQFFLVRNRGSAEVGERWHCTRCSTYHVENGIKVLDPIYHEFFTWACVRRPWRGLQDALWGYASLTNNEQLAGQLQRWNPSLAASDPLARSHPETYGRMLPPDAEADIVAVAVGTLEKITADEAYELVRRINQRRPPQPFVL